MKTVLYCRVSSKEQEETGYSLDSQIKLLNEYAEKNDLQVVKTYRISESASGKQIRKSFNEMLDYSSKNKIPLILCEKIDRLTRNLKSASIADEWVKEDSKREIHFVKESFILNANTKAHENLVWDMKVAIARFYTNNLSEEVKKGQVEKIRQGWLPTRPPIGYKTIGEKGHKIHVIDEDTAPLILKMFEIYDSGNFSVKTLVDKMFNEGLRNRAGRKIGKSRIYDLLSYPFYYGKIEWKGNLFDGQHKALISKELFDSVQNKLNRKYKNPAHRRHFPIFRAKLSCGECGGLISWETQKGHWYGRCNHYRMCTQRGCIRQERVEEQVFPFLEKIAPKNERILLWLEKALKESHAEKNKYHNAKRDALTKVIASIDSRVEKLYEDKIDGLISSDFYKKKFTEWQETRDNSLIELKKLDESNVNYYDSAFSIHELASKAKEIYQSPNSSVEEKRLLLSYVFTNLVLLDGKITPKYTLAFEFLENWIPKLNRIYEPQKRLTKQRDVDQIGIKNKLMLPG